MSRSGIEQAVKPRSKRIGAAWRGVGCVMIMALTLGAYWFGGVLIKIYRATPSTPLQIPGDFGFTVGPIDVPIGIGRASTPPRGVDEKGRPVVTVGPIELTAFTILFTVSWLQLAMAAVVDVLLYGVFVTVYSRANPIKRGPTDAPPVYPRKGRPKNLSR